MRGHLTEEEITLFAAHQIKGKERVYILTHLEMCEMCRTRITSPSEAEIVKRLTAEDISAECNCEEKKAKA